MKQIDDYPLVLILKEKYGERYFFINDDKTLHDICQKIIIERCKECYYDEVDEALRDVLCNYNFIQEDKPAVKYMCYNFLANRSDYEYEGFDMRQFENELDVFEDKETIKEN